MSCFCSLMLRGFTIDKHFIAVTCVIREGNHNTAFESELALFRLLASQFHGVLLYWFWNSCSWEMASSVLTMEGNMSKNASCASCRSTHLVRKRVVFFTLGASFSFVGVGGGGRFRNPCNPPLGTPLNYTLRPVNF